MLCIVLILKNMVVHLIISELLYITVACHKLIRKMAAVTSSFCRVDFEKKMKLIFYDNEILNISRWFSEIFSAFGDFFKVISLYNYRLQTNMAPNQRKNVRGQKQVVIQMLDFTCKTGMMFGINSKNFEVTF